MTLLLDTNMNDTESRKEWVNSLKVGSKVVVKTQIRTYDGLIEDIKDNRMWVLFKMGGESFSLTWVNPETGNNPATRVTISPFVD